MGDGRAAKDVSRAEGGSDRLPRIDLGPRRVPLSHAAAAENPPMSKRARGLLFYLCATGMAFAADPTPAPAPSPGPGPAPASATTPATTPGNAPVALDPVAQ